MQPSCIIVWKKKRNLKNIYAKKAAAWVFTIV